jgi:exopolysaccharide biosynthesis polyprenyl glycosylphosphotransferase
MAIDLACFNFTYALVDLFQLIYSPNTPRFLVNHSILINGSIWLIVAGYFRVYRAYLNYSMAELLRQTWRALIVQQVIVAIILKINTGSFYFKDVILIKIGLLFFFIFLVRYLLVRIDLYYENRADHFNRIGIYGFNLDAIHLAYQFELRYHGRKFAGIINEFKSSSPFDESLPIFQQVIYAIDYAKNAKIRELYICIPSEYIHDLNYLFLEAEKKFVRLNIVPSSTDSRKWAYPIQEDFGIKFITRRIKPLDSKENRIYKRVFDIIFSLLVICFILSWLYPLLGLLIKCQSPGPIIFKQKRTGRGNKIFWCYKFRSMHVNTMSDLEQAKKDDSRLTPIGSFIRKTSIDEFPQFVNVLLGSMSVVGPRPHMLYHSETYQRMVEGFTFRHFVKPGITGLAQISGLRGEVNGSEILEARIQKDIEYIENWHLIQDIKICFLTIYFLFAGDENAY